LIEKGREDPEGFTVVEYCLYLSFKGSIINPILFIGLLLLLIY